MYYRILNLMRTSEKVFQANYFFSRGTENESENHFQFEKHFEYFIFSKFEKIFSESLFDFRQYHVSPRQDINGNV